MDAKRVPTDQPMPAERTYDLAALTDKGTERPHNEDACGLAFESGACAVLAVADGVSGNEGGETASAKAVEVLLRSFGEQGAQAPALKRLGRAIQQANIEVYELALAVPELRGMATTLTAAAIDGGTLAAVHVGDSRLYLLRDGVLSQLSKDHTVTGEQVRLGLMSEEKARKDPRRSVLTKSLGRELIVAADRFTAPLRQGDALLLCSDGLCNVLPEAEIAALLGDQELGAAATCRALLDAANRLGTYDNLTAAVARLTGPLPAAVEAKGLGERLRSLVGSLRRSR
jgi:protein phosphatase